MAQLASESERVAAAPAIANPAPLGLCGFAMTTFVLSAINAGWFSAGATTIVIGLAVFYGGLCQLLTGMWEFRGGNTFGGVAFTSYGAFWLSFAAIFIPWFGVSLAKDVAGQAVGLYLLGWTIFTALMFIGTLRSNIALVAVFGLLTITFLLLALANLLNASGLTVLGGYFGILTALAAWYTALAGVLASVKAVFTLPVGPLS